MKCASAAMSACWLGKEKLHGWLYIPKLELSLLCPWHAFILIDTNIVLSLVQPKLGKWGEGWKDFCLESMLGVEAMSAFKSWIFSDPFF